MSSVQQAAVIEALETALGLRLQHLRYRPFELLQFSPLDDHSRPETVRWVNPGE